MNTLFSVHSRRRMNSGMTLVETLVAIFIFIVLLGAVTAFQISIYSNQRVVSGSLQTAQDAQIILKTILTELRSASQAANGAYPIASAATSSLVFFSDANKDGQAEQIGYRLIGTTLYRTTIPPAGSPVGYSLANQSTTTLLNNVRNSTSTPLFQYYDQNYTGTSTPLALPVNASAVRLVQVSVTLDVNPALSPIPRTYTVQVGLRNLKTNL